MRDIFKTPEAMALIREIKSFEENRFTDIPNWSGGIDHWSDKFDGAILIILDLPEGAGKRDHWIPYSQLRKAEDGQSIYASNWILDKKGL